MSCAGEASPSGTSPGTAAYRARDGGPAGHGPAGWGPTGGGPDGGGPDGVWTCRGWPCRGWSLGGRRRRWSPGTARAAAGHLPQGAARPVAAARAGHRHHGGGDGRHCHADHDADGFQLTAGESRAALRGGQRQPAGRVGDAQAGTGRRGEAGGGAARGGRGRNTGAGGRQAETGGGGRADAGGAGVAAGQWPAAAAEPRVPAAGPDAGPLDTERGGDQRCLCGFPSPAARCPPAGDGQRAQPVVHGRGRGGARPNTCTRSRPAASFRTTSILRCCGCRAKHWLPA